MRTDMTEPAVQSALRISRWLRRPQLMVFLPALTLTAFWLGGERSLLAVALGVPFVFALAGAFRFDAPAADAEGGVPLRRQVVAALDRALAARADDGGRTGCLVLLFDDAQTFVDRHGRAAQTAVIQRIGERLVTALRQTDTIAQLEGGGFAVALGAQRRLDLETAVQIAARLQSVVAEPVSVDALRMHVTCSVGFCLDSQAPAPTGVALLDAAQIAADAAARIGAGTIRAFSPGMARSRADRDALRDALEAALDDGQIRAHFQPQISADTGSITGFEALARWHHPERGLIAPAEFLPAIADAGLSERLSETMLYQSLVALSRWDRAGLGVPTVSVNFSEEELRNPRLADKLRWELDRFDLTPDRLSIEILETVVAATDDDVIVNNIAALARLGCGIDLDDFGTGHTSIANLRRFSVRRVKIDRSFVTRVDEDRDQQRMVAAILSLAERLGIDTLAEGVETRGEQAMLSQLGCGHLQGFAIARPMPVEETADWIARHNASRVQPPRIGQRAGKG
jgi:predicted signal transduction protein with EAL and GGDEF domain